MMQSRERQKTRALTQHAGSRIMQKLPGSFLEASLKLVWVDAISQPCCSARDQGVDALGSASARSALPIAEQDHVQQAPHLLGQMVDDCALCTERDEHEAEIPAALEEACSLHHAEQALHM